MGEWCEIVLLPALPKDWDSGHVTGLRTRCGVEVDLSWSEGRLQRANLSWVWGGEGRSDREVGVHESVLICVSVNVRSVCGMRVCLVTISLMSLTGAV